MRNRANIVVGALVVLALVASVAFFCVMRLGGAGAGAGALRAVVHDGDGGVWVLPLSEDAEQAVTTSLGSNVVVVEDGAVFVREADCDNQDCVHQGKASVPGQQIICLPHKLWIEVRAEGDAAPSEMDVDAVIGGGETAGELDAVAR